MNHKGAKGTKVMEHIAHNVRNSTPSVQARSPLCVLCGIISPQILRALRVYSVNSVVTVPLTS